MKKIFALLLTLVMALSLVACGEKDSDANPTGGSGSTGDTIKLGWYGPLSGSAASVGTSGETAAKLAVKQINESGGSAVFASVAGSMYAHFIGFISPETFNSAQSNLQMTMLLFGGTGNPVGPIFGASVIAILNESLQSFSTYKTLIYGVLVLIAVLFMPRGCFGLGQDLVNKIRKRGGKAGMKNAEN